LGTCRFIFPAWPRFEKRWPICGKKKSSLKTRVTRSGRKRRARRIWEFGFTISTVIAGNSTCREAVEWTVKPATGSRRGDGRRRVNSAFRASVKPCRARRDCAAATTTTVPVPQRRRCSSRRKQFLHRAQPPTDTTVRLPRRIRDADGSAGNRNPQGRAARAGSRLASPRLIFPARPRFV
jgi:hypothetical protein